MGIRCKTPGIARSDLAQRASGAFALHGCGTMCANFLPSFGVFGRKKSSNRDTPRHRQTGLTCNLGDIVDLSTSGLRLRCRHALAGRVDVVLTEYTRKGELSADVIWMKPVGQFHYEVGLKFRKLTREMSSRLGAITMSHRFRRAI